MSDIGRFRISVTGTGEFSAPADRPRLAPVDLLARVEHPALPDLVVDFEISRRTSGDLVVTGATIRTTSVSDEPQVLATSRISRMRLASYVQAALAVADLRTVFDAWAALGDLPELPPPAEAVRMLADPRPVFEAHLAAAQMTNDWQTKYPGGPSVESKRYDAAFYSKFLKRFDELVAAHGTREAYTQITDEYEIRRNTAQQWVSRTRKRRRVQSAGP